MPAVLVNPSLLFGLPSQALRHRVLLSSLITLLHHSKRRMLYYRQSVISAAVMVPKSAPIIQLVPNNQCAGLMRNAPKHSDNDLIHPGCLRALEKRGVQLKGFRVALIILGIVPAHLKV